MTGHPPACTCGWQPLDRLKKPHTGGYCLATQDGSVCDFILDHIESHYDNRTGEQWPNPDGLPRLRARLSGTDAPPP